MRGNTLTQVLLSAGLGIPVGLIATYTMPRGSWHYWREHDWSVGYVPQADGGVVAFSGRF